MYRFQVKVNVRYKVNLGRPNRARSHVDVDLCRSSLQINTLKSNVYIFFLFRIGYSSFQWYRGYGMKTANITCLTVESSCQTEQTAAS